MRGNLSDGGTLYKAPGVRELLMARDVEGFEAPLRGVEGNARVYRVTGRS